MTNERATQLDREAVDLAGDERTGGASGTSGAPDAARHRDRPASSPVVELRNVRRLYATDESDAPAAGLHDVSLAVPPGIFAAVTGPSGSGKTTLLNVVAGLDQADSGEVVVCGVDLRRARAAALARFRLRSVGIVFQDSLLVPELGVLANVALPAVLAGEPRPTARRRALQLLDDLNLGGLGQRMPHELSGGQRQRVAVARAVVNRPPLLVADEPTGNLDTVQGSLVVQMLTDLNEQGTTVVLVTHDESIAARAELHIHIVDGRLSAS